MNFNKEGEGCGSARGSGCSKEIIEHFQIYLIQYYDASNFISFFSSFITPQCCFKQEEGQVAPLHPPLVFGENYL